MANRNNPRGLVPFTHGSGGTPGRTNPYAIADGLAQNLYKGDPVTLTGAGTVIGPNITIAGVTDTSPILGVFVGVSYIDSLGRPQFRRNWVSGTATNGEPAKALVLDDPDQLYTIQVDGVGLVSANVGQAAPLVDVGTGDAQTGISAAQLDQSNIDTAGQAYIVGLSPYPGGNEFGEFADAIVRLKTAQFRAVGQAGV